MAAGRKPRGSPPRRAARRSPAGPRAPTLELSPIGFARTPFIDKRSAPRQPAAARGVAGTIELLPRAELEHALQDLESFSHVWVIFWFHQNQGFRPKVEPPRSHVKRGLFATRAPYRPNPLGLSVLRLTRIEGRVLHVLDVDLLDGTPILDIKPYVPYTDAVPNASSGWLETAPNAAAAASSTAGPLDSACEPPPDPVPRHAVRYDARAEEQLRWLAERTDLPLRALAEEVLVLGPAPHPYRRIKRDGDAFRLAIKDFRLRFVVERDTVRVLELATGYRSSVLRDPAASATERTSLEVHRAFVKRFGPRAAK